MTPMKFAGEAPRPGPGRGETAGSSTTLMLLPRRRSYQEFATMPVSRA